MRKTHQNHRFYIQFRHGTPEIRIVTDDYADVTLGIYDRTQDPYYRSVYFDNLYVGLASPSGSTGDARGASNAKGSFDESSAAAHQDPIYLSMIGDDMEETCRDMFGSGMRVLFMPQDVTVTCPLEP